MKTLAISASPREDGNSQVLAQSAIDGARWVGHDVAHVFLDEYVDRMLGNCRRCRRPDGSCSLGDRYEELLISCEESYLGATQGVIAQLQEITRYLRQDLVGVVVGNANSRGEIVRDPSDPLSCARDLGARLFDIRVTDYRLDTVRSNRVWEQPA